MVGLIATAMLFQSKLPLPKDPNTSTFSSYILAGLLGDAEKLYKEVGSLKHPIRKGDQGDILSYLVSASDKAGHYANVLTGIRWCIERGADPKENYSAALHVASYTDRWVKVTRRLLEKGADPNAATRKGMESCLMRAIDGQKAKNVEVLIEYKADVNALSPYSSRLPITEAAKTGQLEILKLLVSKGAKVNAKLPKSGRTALHEAALANQGGTITYLLRMKADPKVKDSSGQTPLQLARKNKKQVSVMALTGKLK